MLARHGLTAREEILGMATLVYTALVSAHDEHPDLVQMTGKAPPVSPANLALLKSHAAAIHQHGVQLALQQLQANQGKLPACFSAQ
jgi:hypothetical protein